MENKKSGEGRSGMNRQADSPPVNTATSRIAILREAHTSLGLVELRRRWSLALRHEVLEILLDGDLMMSSAVHVSEDALAECPLAAILQDDLKVLVGGLGLGFTTLRVLADRRVRSVAVVELLAPVIDWHRDGSIPWSQELISDPRVELIQADFFAYLSGPATPESLYDLILVDIDDGPEHVWNGAHAEFYTQRGLLGAMAHLQPGGILAFWFAVRPSEEFLSLFGTVMRNAKIESISFDDPSLHKRQENFIVLGHRLTQDVTEIERHPEETRP